MPINEETTKKEKVDLFRRTEENLMKTSLCVNTFKIKSIDLNTSNSKALKKYRIENKTFECVWLD